MNKVEEQSWLTRNGIVYDWNWRRWAIILVIEFWKSGIAWAIGLGPLDIMRTPPEEWAKAEQLELISE